MLRRSACEQASSKQYRATSSEAASSRPARVSEPARTGQNTATVTEMVASPPEGTLPIQRDRIAGPQRQVAKHLDNAYVTKIPLLLTVL
jgi:hypothetical protein